MSARDDDSTDPYAAFDTFLERFDLLVETDPASALAWVDAADEAVRDQSEWVLCRADALRAAIGPEAARQYLAQVLEAEPEFADAHYAMAEVERTLGNTQAAIRHELETLRLDSAVDFVACPASADLSEAIAAEAAMAVSELPAQVKARLSNVPIFLQPRPSEQLVADGLDARSLGLFEGPNLADTTLSSPDGGPTAITIFTHCLADAFGDDEDEMLRQVRVTVLHEVGHYFCLEEEQLAELGLD
ncbi:MAG: metallopeptidase family protein [Myxococcales bacterium]